MNKKCIEETRKGSESKDSAAFQETDFVCIHEKEDNYLNKDINQS